MRYLVWLMFIVLAALLVPLSGAAFDGDTDTGTMEATDIIPDVLGAGDEPAPVLVAQVRDLPPVYQIVTSTAEDWRDYHGHYVLPVQECAELNSTLTSNSLALRSDRRWRADLILWSVERGGDPPLRS